MKFYLSNTDLDTQITEIRKTIRLSMNGIVSDQMKNSGIIYKKSYGVTIPRIKEIAQKYQPNHDLAQRLWMLQIRETMILATWLEPVDKFTGQMAQNWADSFDQIEIIEQCCMNLFSKLPFATSLATTWIESDKLWLQVTGFVLAARVFEKFNATEIPRIIQKAINLSTTHNFHLYKSIALCLSRICRNSSDIATYIQQELEIFSTSTISGQKYIYNEVKQEILFLEIL